MARKQRGILVGVWMTELQLSQLEYVQEPGETRSDTMRRLVNEKWCDQNMAFDAENRFNVTDYLPPNI